MANETNFRLNNESQKWGGIQLWTLVFDLQGEKVNKLSRSVMEDFEKVLSELESLGKQNKVDALVLLSGKPGNFIAGADIEMIQSLKTAEEAEALSRSGQQLMDRWEDLPFPTITAIDGAALGGGLEFALASTAIITSNAPSVKLGLPEVMLGVIPGMGGCVRLPRKAGLATALDLILTGKTLNGDRAYKLGLTAALIPWQDFQTAALKWTRAHLEELKSGNKHLGKKPKLGGVGGAAGALMEKTPMGRMLIFKKAREGVLSKTKGHYPAPMEVLSVIQETIGRDRLPAMEREARGFGKVAASEVSKNLVRIFFMNEAAKKSQEAGRAVHHAVVLGAGVMGGGIAQLLADKGTPVRMKDLNVQALTLGSTAAAKIFQKQVKRRKITQRQLLQKMNLIAPVADYSGFHQADVVIEAIIEKIDIKKKAFQELEDYIRPDCVVASNTSSLSISEMQKGMKHPERFVGMHFFNPVHKMPLIEVIRGEQSSQEALATVYQLSRQLGKTPIIVKDQPGFLVNRLLMPYLNEATWLLSEGVSISELDCMLLNFGMPMGPMELIDEIGIDVAEKVAHILYEAFGERVQPSNLNQKLVAAQYLGRKNGKGLYTYDPQGRKKEVNPEVYSVLGVEPRSNVKSSEEILERCIFPMVNEAARCLEEKIVNTAEEVDLGMIMGTGFPPFRGGLLRYADSIGAQKIMNQLQKYEKKYGKRFEPSPALTKHAQNGRSFCSHL